MRVDLQNSAAIGVTSDLASQQVAAQSAPQSGAASGEDRTTLSSDSASVGSLVKQALSTPEIRQSTVNSLRLAVTSGQYDLDPAKIAASIVDQYA